MAVSVGFAAHLVDLFDWFGWHLGFDFRALPHSPRPGHGASARHPGSAETNNVMVLLKIAAILSFIFVGIGFIHPTHYHPCARRKAGRAF